MEDFSNFVAFSEYSNFNSAVEIEPDFANCRQWLHNFIEEQQIQIYLLFFQFEQCVGNQKTNYDNKKTLQTVHQNLRLTNNHFTIISSKFFAMLFTKLRFRRSFWGPKWV